MTIFVRSVIVNNLTSQSRLYGLLFRVLTVNILSLTVLERKTLSKDD